MSSGAVKNKPSAADYTNAVENLCKLTGAREANARRAYETALYLFPRAIQILEAEARQREVESLKSQKRKEDRQFQQAILFYRYQGQIRPAIQDWTRSTHKFDPMTNPTDCYLLMEEMIERGISLDPQREGEQVRIKLQQQNGQSWKTGEGLGDNLREAVVLAFWNTFGDDYNHV